MVYDIRADRWQDRWRWGGQKEKMSDACNSRDVGKPQGSSPKRERERERERSYIQQVV